MEPEIRARDGVFLAFQYPGGDPGRCRHDVPQRLPRTPSANTAVKKNSTPCSFLKLVRAKQADLDMTDDMVRRPVNVGFSGGEKKRYEMLQMAMLEPALAILDETDSGLDIDALKTVADGINALRSPDRAMLMITHYQRLLDYVVPDFVHVLAGGKIVRSGDKSLALELEKEGYAVLGTEAA